MIEEEEEEEEEEQKQEQEISAEEDHTSRLSICDDGSLGTKSRQVLLKRTTVKPIL